MNTKIEYKRSKENQQNHELVPLLLVELENLYSAISAHDKTTIDGKLLKAMDRTESFLDSIK